VLAFNPKRKLLSSFLGPFKIPQSNHFINIIYFNIKIPKPQNEDPRSPVGGISVSLRQAAGYSDEGEQTTTYHEADFGHFIVRGL
jgi:hypothetical protein